MTNIFIFGASIAHGVGGEDGGWADMLKRSLYNDMYGPHTAGRVCDVYELGVPNTAMADLSLRFEAELMARLPVINREQTYVLFMTGTNDAKAYGGPRDFVNSPEDFARQTQAFITTAKKHAAHVRGIGVLPVDESKANRVLIDAERGVYFPNARLKTFNEVLAQQCKAQEVDFISLFDIVPATWVQSYLSADGIHPNNAGHQWLLAQIEPKLRSMLGSLR